MRRAILAGVLTAGLILPVSPAISQEQGKVFRQWEDGNYTERVSRTIRVTPGGTLYLVNDQGEVQVDVWYQNEVRVEVEKRSGLPLEVEARALFRDFDVSIHPEGKDVRVLARSRTGRPSRLDVRVKLFVPDRYHVEVHASEEGVGVGRVSGNLAVKTSGDIDIAHAERNVTVSSSGGGINVGESEGDVSATAGGGPVRVGRVGGAVKATTSGGGIRIGTASGDVFASTSGGEIRIDEGQQGVDARTQGGDVRVGRAGGPVRLSTSGGNIVVRGALGAIEARTDGGSIEAELATADRSVDTHCDLETTGGDITLYLPEALAANLYAEIQVKRRSGREYRILSDFPMTVRSDDPRRILGEGKINGGGPAVSMKAVNGDIFLRKRAMGYELKSPGGEREAADSTRQSGPSPVGTPEQRRQLEKDLRQRRDQLYQAEIEVRQAQQAFPGGGESNRLRSEGEAVAKEKLQESSAISQRDLSPEGKRYALALERREQLRQECYRLERQLRAPKEQQYPPSSSEPAPEQRLQTLQVQIQYVEQLLKRRRAELQKAGRAPQVPAVPSDYPAIREMTPADRAAHDALRMEREAVFSQKDQVGVSREQRESLRNYYEFLNREMEQVRSRRYPSWSQNLNTPTDPRGLLEVECEMLEGQMQILVRQRQELLLRQAADQTQRDSQDQEIRRRAREMMKLEGLPK